MSSSSTTPPVLAAVAFIVVGLLIGFLASAIAGTIIAGLGVIPSMWAIVSGMQQETQTQLGVAILLVIASLGAAALIAVVGIVGLFS